MSKVLIDISMSLDGFVVAPGATPEEPLGANGEQLQEWAFRGSAEERALLTAAVEQTGAIIMGRKTYEDSRWGSDGPSGPARIPTVIVTHTAPADVPENGVYTFVSGIEEAVATARKIAGDRNVGVGGGASIVRQVIASNLADGLLLHVVPILFGLVALHGTLAACELPSPERLAAASVQELKNVYLRCAEVSSRIVLDSASMAGCARAADALRDRAFGGDFERMIAWWQDARQAPSSAVLMAR